MEDDIKLMEESLLKTKKWATIAKEFPGRTQHHIKNRFISVMCVKLGLTREKIRSSFKNNLVIGSVYEILSILKADQTIEKDKNNEKFNMTDSIQSTSIGLDEIFLKNQFLGDYKEEELDFFSDKNNLGNEFISFY